MCAIIMNPIQKSLVIATLLERVEVIEMFQLAAADALTLNPNDWDDSYIRIAHQATQEWRSASPSIGKLEEKVCEPSPLGLHL